VYESKLGKNNKDEDKKTKKNSYIKKDYRKTLVNDLISTSYIFSIVQFSYAKYTWIYQYIQNSIHCETFYSENINFSMIFLFCYRTFVIKFMMTFGNIGNFFI
jgi:hypothetical protein